MLYKIGYHYALAACPCLQLLSFLLLKDGHGIFNDNMQNEGSDCPECMLYMQRQDRNWPDCTSVKRTEK